MYYNELEAACILAKNRPFLHKSEQKNGKKRYICYGCTTIELTIIRY